MPNRLRSALLATLRGNAFGLRAVRVFWRRDNRRRRRSAAYTKCPDASGILCHSGNGPLFCLGGHTAMPKDNVPRARSWKQIWVLMFSNHTR